MIVAEFFPDMIQRLFLGAEETLGAETLIETSALENIHYLFFQAGEQDLNPGGVQALAQVRKHFLAVGIDLIDLFADDDHVFKVGCGGDDLLNPALEVASVAEVQRAVAADDRYVLSGVEADLLCEAQGAFRV